jgi:hypothetical protein
MLDLGLIGTVAVDEEGANAEGSTGITGRLGLGLRARVVDDDIGTLASQLDGRRRTDASRRTGDYCDLAGQSSRTHPTFLPVITAAPHHLMYIRCAS